MPLYCYSDTFSSRSEIYACRIALESDSAWARRHLPNCAAPERRRVTQCRLQSFDTITHRPTRRVDFTAVYRSSDGWPLIEIKDLLSMTRPSVCHRDWLLTTEQLVDQLSTSWRRCVTHRQRPSSQRKFWRYLLIIIIIISHLLVS